MSERHPVGPHMTGLSGRRLHLNTDDPTSPDGADISCWSTAEAADVIAVDDAPTAELTLQVHLVDDPRTPAKVPTARLTLYDVPDPTPDPRTPVHRIDARRADLRGRQLRLIADLPTNLAGDPQPALRGHTEVLAFDDTPTASGELRVHPIGAPDALAIVVYDQLALYQP